MGDKRLGRVFTPQGSAAIRQPSPYHYLEFFDTAPSCDSEELISFDDDSGDTSAEVPISSVLLFRTSLILKSRTAIIRLQPRIL